MDDYITNAGKVLGVTLDLSLSHTKEGRRIIDTVKKQLMDFVRNTMEGEDLFYLYHPELSEPIYDIGSIVSAIGNYETDGWLFDLRYALKLTYYVIAAQDPDAEKTLLLITDRVQDAAAVQNLLLVETREQVGCQFVLAGIGSCYKRSVLDVQHDQIRYFHINDPSLLSDILLEKLV